MEVDVGRDLLREREPALVVRERPVGVANDARVIGAAVGIAAIVLAWLFVSGFLFSNWMIGTVSAAVMIGALALWFPLQPLVWMLIVMSLLGGALTLLLVIERALRRNSGAIEIPYGVAIAISALLALREPIFNQFL